MLRHKVTYILAYVSLCVRLLWIARKDGLELQQSRLLPR